MKLARGAHALSVAHALARIAGERLEQSAHHLRQLVLLGSTCDDQHGHVGVVLARGLHNLVDLLREALLDHDAEIRGILLGGRIARLQELRHLIRHRLVRLLNVLALSLTPNRAGQAKNTRV